jgi:hypothetical protein
VNTLLQWWNRTWFTPSTPTHLVFARIVFYGYLAIRATELDSHVWAEFSTVAWKPVSFFHYLGRPPSAGILRALDAAFIVSLWMACVGALSRVSMASAAVLGLYLFGLPNNFFKVNHGSAAAVYVLIFLAFSRAGDVFSIDAVVRQRLGKPAAPALSGEYTWPIRAVWLAIALIYFCAGIAKVERTGLSWALSNNLKLLLIRHHYSHEPPTNLGLFVASMDPWPRLLAVLSLGLELAAPLALAHRYLRYIIGMGLLGMQLSIWLMLGVFFQGTIVSFLIFWAPWGPWLEALRDRMQRFAHARLRVTGPKEEYDG